MPWKVSFLFNAGRSGWTETFFWPAIGSASLDAVKAAAGTLSLARVGSLAPTLHIDAARISDPLVPFRSDYVNFNGPAWDAPGGDTGHDQINVCWMYRVASAGSLYRRNLYLRGARDDAVVYSPTTGQVMPSPGFVNAIEPFLSRLVVDGWGMRVISKVDADVGLVDVTGATVVGTSITYAAPGHTFAVKDRVRVSGLAGLNARQLNLTGTVKAVGAGATFEIDVLEAPTLPIILTKTGKARRQRLIYQAIEIRYPVRPVTHKTGRAFFASAGRRSPTR